MIPLVVGSPKICIPGRLGFLQENASSAAGKDIVINR